MVRTLAGATIIAVIGVLALKLLFALVGIGFFLVAMAVKIALIGFVIYVVLRLFAPDRAQRMRNWACGEPVENG